MLTTAVGLRVRNIFMNSVFPTTKRTKAMRWTSFWRGKQHVQYKTTQNERRPMRCI
jgi:hypothetical protein